jgi:hypothetical protein
MASTVPSLQRVNQAENLFKAYNSVKRALSKGPFGYLKVGI